jgi:D-tyrosyl-tRNA(Tyr) deacylase
MRVVIQRGTEAEVKVDGQRVGAIGAGLLLLAAVERGDTDHELRWMAGKIANLRIFRDEAGVKNLSVLDAGGGVLLVPNFTVAGDCRKGRRPGYERAMEPERARGAMERFAGMIREYGLAVETGVFGAQMVVSLVNDGPVTIVIEKRPREGDG